MGMKDIENSQHFTRANQNAKLVRAIATLVRRARLDYEGFRRVCALVRKELEIRRPRRSRRLPHILSDADLKKFYEAIDQAGNLQHQIMLRLLFYRAWPG
jgi:integrase/recombinase XerD